MNGNFWKGLGLCILGLLLWVVFSFGAAFSPSEYGPHIFMGLSFTLMVFGPVLFWIVFPLKERWYDKGKRRRFYAVMAPIGLIFLIFLGVAFLPPEVPKTSVTTEVVDHKGTASMRVTVEGEKDSYDLILSDSEENTVGAEHISSSEMSDGRETIWLSMAGYFTQAKAGTYTLVIEDSMGDKVYEDEFTYSGPDLEIEWGSPEFTYVEGLGYYLECLPVTVSNDGDLPAYVLGMKVSIAGKEGASMLSSIIPTGEYKTLTSSHFTVIPAGETATVKRKFLFMGPIEEGSYRATCELKTHLPGQGIVTLATDSAIVQVP